MEYYNIYGEIEKAWTHIPGETLNPRFGQFGKRTSKSKQIRGYTASVWAFICTNILGKAAAGMPWGLFRGDELTKGTAAQALFDFFSENQNPETELRNTMMDMQIHGFGVWRPEIVGGHMIRIKRLPASQITPADEAQDGIEPSHYFWTHGSFQEVIPKEELAIFKLYGSVEDDPDSPMRIVIEKAYAEQKIDELAVVHFDRSGIPPYFMTSDQNVSEKDLERYDTWFRRKFEGVVNKLRIAWTGGGLKPTRMMTEIKNMVLSELRADIRLEVCAGFQVPLAIAGGAETIFKATWNQQMIAMHHLKVNPDMKMMAGVINAQMMPFIDPGLTFKFLPEQLEVLQEERTERSNRIMNEWEKGLIDQETALNELGYEQSQAGAGLVSGAAADPALLTPGEKALTIGDWQNNFVMMEEGRVRRKAKRIFQTGGNIDDVGFNSDYITPDRIGEIVEGVFHETN